MKEIFFEAFFSLVRLFLNTKDEFLKQKLIKKTREIFDVICVAQSADNNLIKKLIDDINEFIEILIHLKASDLSPALLVQKNLLRLRSEIMDFVPEESRTESGAPSVQGPTLVVAPTDVDISSTIPPLRGTLVVDKSKNKVLNSKYKNLGREIIEILKGKPEGLFLREIISALSSHCSRRTVQRYLNQLILNGLLFKKGLNNSAKYTTLPVQGPTLVVAPTAVGISSSSSPLRGVPVVDN